MAKGLPKFSEDDILKALQERKRTVDATRALSGGMVATLEIKSQFDDSRMDVIRDMSQKEADRIIGVVRNEEMKLAGAMKSAATNQNQPLIQLLNFYRDSLQRIYYQSTQQKTAVIGESEIEQTYLPQIEKLIQAIKQDKILKEYKVTTTVLQLAEKIKQELVNRTKLKTKLKDSAKNKISGFLGKDSAFSKSNLVGLALSAFLNRKQSKNLYAIAAQNNQQNLNTQQAQTRAETDAVEFEQQKQDTAKKERDAIAEKARRQRAKKGKETTPETLVTNGGSGLVGVDGQPLSSLPTAPELSAPVSSSLDGSGSEIVKILSQHTSLLGKIFGVNSQMLKLQQDKMAKDAAAAEESGLETQGGGKERAGLLPTATKEEEQGGGGFMGLAMNLLSSRFPMLRGLRGAGGLLRGGARLAGGLLRGGARRAGLTTLGLGAAAAGANTITQTATKELGTEAAEAAAKKGAGELAQAGAKKGAKGAIGSIIRKIVPKTIAKAFGKSIPFVGAAIGGMFALGKLLKGDTVGAGLEAASGLGGPITAIPLTIVSMTRDVYQEAYGVNPETDPQAGERLSEIKSEVTDATNEELAKLTGKGAKDAKETEQSASQEPTLPAQEAPTSPSATPTAPETGNNLPSPPAPPATPAAAAAPPTPPAPPATPAATAAPSAPSVSARPRRSATRARTITNLDDAKKMTMDFEGVRYRPYKDSLGLWTVGVGHLIGNGRSLPPDMNREFSHEEVVNLFNADYEHHKKAAMSIPGFGKFNKTGQAALVDLTFNMGPRWISKFKQTAKAIAAGNAEGTASGLENSLWYRQVGRRGPAIVSMIRAGTGPDNGQPTATDTGASQSTGAATQAPPNVAETGGGNAGSAPPAPTTASAGGDTTATGRAVIAGSIAAPAAAPAGGGGGNVTNIMQGGTTLAGGGGGGSASTPIPAPIDREPTIRRILDGALT